jgi:hypothetical protein
VLTHRVRIPDDSMSRTPIGPMAMSESKPEESTPQSDDAWKDRVKAEDAALDRSSQETAQFPDVSQEEQPGEPAMELPPPTFASLVQLLATQSMTALGLVPAPDGRPHLEPQIARHFIDLLGVLESKTQGQLDPGEQALLEGVLHQLRMAYMAVIKDA